MDIDNDAAARLAELFSALSDSSRIRLVAALTGTELNVTELAEQIGLSRPAVSNHLRHLRQMRLVRSRKEGRRVYYLLDDAHIEELFRCGLEHVRHG